MPTWSLVGSRAIVRSSHSHARRISCSVMAVEGMVMLDMLAEQIPLAASTLSIFEFLYQYRHSAEDLDRRDEKLTTVYVYLPQTHDFGLVHNSINLESPVEYLSPVFLAFRIE